MRSNFRALFLLFTVVLATVCPGPQTRGQRASESDGSARWEVLKDCRLVASKSFDGDSFHLRHGQREYIIRLYGVDAPETDTEFSERVDEQCRHFGLNRDQLLEVAAAARNHLRSALKGRFTVVTRWENALGRSALPRFYGIVLVDTNSLALDLVRLGFARPHGVVPPWPDRAQGQRFHAELREAEQQARRQGVGAWDRVRYPITSAPKPTHPLPLVDLNTATVTELVALPGIGPAMAERIRAGRPFRSVNELRNVSGIGPKTFELLRDRVTVRTNASPVRQP